MKVIQNIKRHSSFQELAVELSELADKHTEGGFYDCTSTDLSVIAKSISKLLDCEYGSYWESRDGKILVYVEPLVIRKSK